MIQLQNVTAAFGPFALGPIDLAVPTGRYCVLLGPPGSGKTSLIELIAGLRPMRSGRIFLGEQRVDLLDPADRRVGYVPQDYALFTTADVFSNIAFGLRVRRQRRALIRSRVEWTAERLGIGHLLGRSCRGLSGGERQRVALARALVLEPKILLLDEPVAALDESTRERVCVELRSLHDSLGMTTIHVSHNFEETRAVADLVGVLNDGRLVQAGTVAEIFRTPVSEFVARFVRAGNVLVGDKGHWALGIGHWEKQEGGAPRAFLLRPRDAALVGSADEVGPTRVGLPGLVAAVQDDGGFQVTVRVAVAGERILAVTVPRMDGQSPVYRAGQQVVVAFDPARLHPLAPNG